MATRPTRDELLQSFKDCDIKDDLLEIQHEKNFLDGSPEGSRAKTQQTVIKDVIAQWPMLSTSDIECIAEEGFTLGDHLIRTLMAQRQGMSPFKFISTIMGIQFALQVVAGSIISIEGQHLIQRVLQTAHGDSLRYEATIQMEAVKRIMRDLGIEPPEDYSHD